MASQVKITRAGTTIFVDASKLEAWLRRGYALVTDAEPNKVDIVSGGKVIDTVEIPEYETTTSHAEKPKAKPRKKKADK